jgi:hypothetical protein
MLFQARILLVSFYETSRRTWLVGSRQVFETLENLNQEKEINMTRFLTSNRSSRVTLALGLVLLMAMPLLAAEIKIDLRTALTGPAFNGEQPKGKAEFQMEQGLKRFIVEVDNINLPNGTVLAVMVNGIRVGSITLVNQGGTLLRSSAARQTVPNITAGTTVAVKFSTTKILGGRF